MVNWNYQSPCLASRYAVCSVKLVIGSTSLAIWDCRWPGRETSRLKSSRVATPGKSKSFRNCLFWPVESWRPPQCREFLCRLSHTNKRITISLMNLYRGFQAIKKVTIFLQKKWEPKNKNGQGTCLKFQSTWRRGLRLVGRFPCRQSVAVQAASSAANCTTPYTPVKTTKRRQNDEMSVYNYDYGARVRVYICEWNALRHSHYLGEKENTTAAAARSQKLILRRWRRRRAAHSTRWWMQRSTPEMKHVKLMMTFAPEHHGKRSQEREAKNKKKWNKTFLLLARAQSRRLAFW